MSDNELPPDEQDLPADPALQDPPQQPEQDPPRPTQRVRLLVDGPMGELGAERDDLPTDWLAEQISAGRVQVIS